MQPSAPTRPGPSVRRAVDRATKAGLGLLIAAFCAVQVPVWLSLSDTATGAVLVSARAVTLTVLCVWAARWLMQRRRGRKDMVDDMELPAAAKRMLRVTVGVLLVMLLAVGVFGPAVFGLPAAGVVAAAVLFWTACGTGMALVVWEQARSSRQARADSERLDALLRDLRNDNTDSGDR